MNSSPETSNNLMTIPRSAVPRSSFTVPLTLPGGAEKTVRRYSCPRPSQDESQTRALISTSNMPGDAGIHCTTPVVSLMVIPSGASSPRWKQTFRPGGVVVTAGSYSYGWLMIPVLTGVLEGDVGD